MILILSTIIFPALLIYFLSVIVFVYGNGKKIPEAPESSGLSVSVIIAVRNGAANLPRLLNQLSSQDYTGDIEFVLVDDESQDQTLEILKEHALEDSRFTILSSTQGNPELSLKKRALSAGIESARGEILLFTDVDCQIPAGWARGMTARFTESIDYVIGYSGIVPDNSLVSVFQSVDFFMLMAAARGMANLQYPWAVTGQNQAFRKELYLLTDGYLPLAHCLQGDDSLYLQVARKATQLTAMFSDNPETHVRGRTESRWSDLIRQRIRWAGDANMMWRYNPIFFLTILGTFLINAGIMAGLVLAFIYPLIWNLLLPTVFLKILAEGILLTIAQQVFGKRISFIDFMIWFLLQPVYITFMGAASFFAAHLGWRGRKLTMVNS